MLQNTSTLTIQSGAEVSLSDQLICNTYSTICNFGDLKTKNMKLSTNDILYNGHKTDITNSLDASQGGNIHNFGKLDVENTIKLNTPSIVYNAPECKIEAKTYEAAGSTNVNFGEMEFDTYDSGEAGGLLYNNCMLFVEHMKAGGIVYLDHGVIAEEKEDDEENELFERSKSRHSSPYICSRES